MKELNSPPNAHLFICCRSRDDKECCSQKGSEQMVQDLKKWTKEKSIHKQIKISKSSCLGHCEKGIVLCIHPQNRWYTDVSSEDLDKIKKMLEEYA